MRTAAGLIAILVGMVGVVGVAEARERSLRDLPGDVWGLAFAWTEPLKQAARESKRFDPVSGVWFGMLEGSATSMEHTVGLFLPEGKPAEVENGKVKLLRYTF